MSSFDLSRDYRVPEDKIPPFVANTSALRVDQDNVIRIGRTRVTLDTLITVYEQGESAEEIVIHFDTLDLADVYEVISLYLRHKAEVTVYLEERNRIADEVRRQLKPLLPSRDLRDRLRARSNARS